MVLPSGPTLPGHLLVVGVDGVRFDVLAAWDAADQATTEAAAAILAAEAPRVSFVYLGAVDYAAGPGIRPGAPPLITRQEQVAPLVLDAAGWPAHRE